jgi:hypothetical protein
VARSSNNKAGNYSLSEGALPAIAAYVSAAAMQTGALHDY